MDLKKLTKQIKEAASKLPTNLCKISPSMLTDDAIIMLQAGVLAAANLVEATSSAVSLLAEEVQNLRDEINELKGEKGKPTIRPQSKPKDPKEPNDNDGGDDNSDGTPDTPIKNPNISSENERKVTNNGKKERRTNEDIKITRTEVITIDKNKLPDDAVFKGYQQYIVQDIKFELDNIEYRREEYYSPSTKRSYVADMPIDYDDSHYGFNIKALIITLHHQGKMSQPSMHEFLLTTYELQIAKSTISRILTDNLDMLDNEKTEIVSAGVVATTYVHIDDTGGRVNGQNRYVHVLCSEYFVAYFTRTRKDRLTILEILGQGIIRHIFDDTTFELMLKMEVSNNVITMLKPYLQQEMTTSALEGLLKIVLGDKYSTAKKQIIEARSIIGYQQLPNAIQILVCDDAPQFKQITELLALCWVHAGRHYKKLNPVVPENKVLTDAFITKLWEYYHKLLDYKNAPQPMSQLVLWLEFDELFGTITGYNDLDERIAKTRSQKENLLVVLEHPEIPLHNNPAELGARAQARRRDISLQTINEKGTTAKDAWMTVVHTAMQLKVNVFKYIKDRISKTMEMPSLAQIITNLTMNVNTT